MTIVFNYIWKAFLTSIVRKLCISKWQNKVSGSGAEIVVAYEIAFGLNFVSYLL